MTASVRSPNPSRRGVRVMIIFFIFMLLHQSDKLLIGPLMSPIMDTFKINNYQWGLINTGALVVGSLLYPVWGWLSDRYHRGKLLALASLIWGSTTWISAIAPTYPFFLVTRSSTGIDDSSYPGLYSLVADYFSPKERGKVYGILQLTQPIGYLIGMMLALVLGGVIGWRAVFYITGSLGMFLAVVIFFGVKEIPRGSSEAELEGVDKEKYKFSWKTAGEMLKKKTMLMIYSQGFFGIFPWNVISYFFFGYLERERHYSGDMMLFTMAPAILVLAAGYPLGGFLGDRLFKRTPRGRLIVSAAGVILGAIFLYITMNIPFDQPVLFAFMLLVTALFIPIAAPNVLSTIYDVTVPEVRSTANAVESFIENIGAAAAPLICGAIADATSLSNAILIICLVSWGLCFIFFFGAMYYIPKDLSDLHAQLHERAAVETVKSR
ncbi:MAG TPA: MFS transporter [Anaerolineaceae bacterium]|nr:MFS transporter [Anaerolineaceae bacterium]